MATSIVVTKKAFGYTLIIDGDGRRPFHAVVGYHPEDAVRVLLHAWEIYRDDGAGVTVDVPPEIEAAISASGPIPWC
jgi:hypothetical protein